MRIFTRAFLTLAALSLVACGGGGGGGTQQPTPPMAGGGGGPLPFPSTPNDPLFANAWHLVNTGQGGGTAGEDCRATQTWDTVGGNGVTIGVLDDGLELAHEDLVRNVATSGHKDYVDAGDDDPSPPTTGPASDHGTAVAGVCAGRGNNGLGSSGVAPYAALVGRRILDASNVGGATDVQIQEALTLNNDVIHIFNLSYGPNDDGQYYSMTQADFDTYVTGITNGRGGRGSLFVRSAGNGGATDGANLDETNSHHGVIVVNSVTNQGSAANYSEQGGSILVCGHSDGGTLGITTTDQTDVAGSNPATSAAGGNYQDAFGGTSSAAPLVSGVIALMLERNANLGWRDVRRILATTARQTNPLDPQWATNGAMRNIHPVMGFGAVDAQAAVTAAATWTNLPALETYTSPTDAVGAPVPDNDLNGVTRVLNITSTLTTKEVDHVVVEIQVPTTEVRHLEIRLTSPAGTVVRLLNPEATISAAGPGMMRLGAAHFMGEMSDGNWTLNVRDVQAGTTAVFTDWRIIFYGH